MALEMKLNKTYLIRYLSGEVNTERALSVSNVPQMKDSTRISQIKYAY